MNKYLLIFNLFLTPSLFLLSNLSTASFANENIVENFDRASVQLILVMGSPGAGKGTQSDLLIKQQPNFFNHISFGDFVRQHIDAKGERWEEFKIYKEQGKLLPDSMLDFLLGHLIKREIATRMESLKKIEVKSRPVFLFDGFPRNNSQYEFFKRHFEYCDKIIFLEVNRNTASKRIENRKIEGRSEDKNASLVEGRLNDFKSQTEPLIRLLEADLECKEKFIKIDGNQSIDEVSKNINLALSSLLPSLH